ncbi:MAG: glycosyltransferase [Legionellaceae bacterium]|nr:glycosyltransferase [Legionellaceae bacterium]
MNNERLPKKKIIHIINGLELGGSETALYRSLCAMRDSKYIFHVIVLNTPGYYSPRIENLDIPVHHLAIQNTNLIAVCYRLLCLMKQIKPDIVQTWLYHADLIGGVGAKLCGVKHIIWGIRCEGVNLKRSTRWIKKTCALLSWIIPDVILTNSKIAAKNHIKAGYNSKKIAIIYNGFDSVTFRRNPLHRKEDGSKIVIGTLARFHPDKNYPNLIQAIQMICSQCDHVYFVLCGQGCHPDNSELNALLTPLIDQDRIILINGVENTASYLNSLDLFVLPSKTEGFPNSLAEAMLCELPCVATDVGEVRDMLGDTGLVVPNNDPNSLAAACLSMLSKSPDERQQLGALARQRIEQHYSTMNNTNQVETLYWTLDGKKIT